MFKLIFKLLAHFAANVAGLLLAAHWLAAFHVDLEPSHIATVAALLMAANMAIKPLLKLIFAPLILLSLGLFTLVINAAILYGIDFLSPYLTIGSMYALFWGAVIISAANSIASWCATLFTAK